MGSVSGLTVVLLRDAAEALDDSEVEKVGNGAVPLAEVDGEGSEEGAMEAFTSNRSEPSCREKEPSDHRTNRALLLRI